MRVTIQKWIDKIIKYKLVPSTSCIRDVEFANYTIIELFQENRFGHNFVSGFYNIPGVRIFFYKIIVFFFYLLGIQKKIKIKRYITKKILHNHEKNIYFTD